MGEYIDVLKVNTPNGIIASLDVTSLFTNVPVCRIIDIILDYVYHHPFLSPPSIPMNTMRELLLICTTEAPFKCPRGKLFVQHDGIAMGSPLGVLFSQAFMASVEEEAFKDPSITPQIHCRYVDDLFICAQSSAQIENLRLRLQEVSGLNFTSELNNDGKLPFLDVLVDSNLEKFTTSVYRKPTNMDKCMNGAGECSEKYKRSVIRAYVRRAIKVCDSWHSLNDELKHVRQMLVNNGYSNREFDSISNKIIGDFLSQVTPDKPNLIKV